MSPPSVDQGNADPEEEEEEEVEEEVEEECKQPEAEYALPSPGRVSYMGLYVVVVLIINAVACKVDCGWHSNYSCQQMESEVQERNLRPTYTMAENPIVMSSPSMPSNEENHAILKASSPSSEELSFKKEDVHATREISSHPKSVNDFASAKDGKSQVLDSSQQMKSEGLGGDLRPASTVAENPVIKPSPSLCSKEENCVILKACVVSAPSSDTLALKKEQVFPTPKISNSCHPKSVKDLAPADDGKSQVLDVDGANTGIVQLTYNVGGCNEPSNDSKADLGGVKDMDSGATKLSSNIGKDIAIGLPQTDAFVGSANGSQNSLKRNVPLEVESKDDVKQIKSRTIVPSSNTEMKDGNKHQGIICAFFAKGWCIRGNSCSFLHIKDSAKDTGQETQGDLDKAKQKRELELEEGTRDNIKRTRTNDQEEISDWHPCQEKNKYQLRDILFPESRFTSKYFNTNLSSCSNHAEGLSIAQNHHMYNGYTSAVLSRSPKLSFVTQKLLNSDKEYNASRSAFSGSEREELPSVGSSRIPIHSAAYISKICSYDWEPSVPFRPSFFITSMNVSSLGDLYDPLRDSIEIPNIGDGSLKASLLIHGSSIQASSQVLKYGDSAVVGKHMSDFNDEKSSVSSHNRFGENQPNKNLVPHEKDCHATEMEITSGTCMNYPNGKIGMGKDVTKSEREWTEHDAKHHGEGSAHKKRVDRDKKINDTDADLQTDCSVQKDSKAMRHFRAALVDLVKELLKPSWHEGRLSKDAHILIVKRSVDKILSTLEPQQIPTTIDATKQYVSLYRGKIAKMVNGYINKFGKS
ncbi:hypothetical protein Ahy_A01g000126 isoform B [Arachis hypogaea]|uniref:C3H1-type domain-containing protein n=1 Tax=Arachis hypogaea TaxID=3818 RepID=A0A445EJH3_ARAHY|nr:hypothetical protein Ahy_A01g000126 isoform A [Arachis hypogaea]RYR75575.1 hypothetical protein Ahy_A01g000126 isoform B [Arachis hypogaea]